MCCAGAFFSLHFLPRRKLLAFLSSYDNYVLGGKNFARKNAFCLGSVVGGAACYDFPLLEGVKPHKRFKAKHFINFNIHENIIFNA